MSDKAIEQQIQAKGLTAPRVTLADLQANIVDTEIVKHVSKTGQVLRWAILTTVNGFAVVGKHSASVSPANDNAEIGEKVAIDNSIDVLWQLMGYALKDQLHRRAVFDAEPKIGGQLIANGRNPHFGGQFEGETAEQAEARRAAVASQKPDTANVAAVDNVRQRPLPGADLPPHQKRVVDEKRELDERKQKLEAFFETPTFAQLDDSEQGRLHAQHAAMVDYSRVLGDRIEAFTSVATA